ncbi:conserved Plasmodium protein, unknown function [Plasmodium knowlesi strain H]|uniref:Uncharacterized protein n=3 Tax=Plasmodium knowlesi TaxID=5850 RepID=A0A5K1UEI4_PLAKH|nr:conserved Plasmodium protein, unknown function [Plasmodium knowlesi strain H]OTN66470.1 Uncharacterized protein PKNOH_S09529600 [Plasmodium knowlesi]CAA9990011.1 conserved Plasmodium protein, unknown function [Plasmodium knowlesi strain H]SBO24611.1 conserved Plasmodium protein, unknown function [Plasmodium knowlesi strain H]SBO26233.1 conserved Plasmodium protein, unknown function [Plasmodium knowlesi strain H]VVS79485.1 conserved Plasmodium protein, unknown function [Plasmodium knowlesi s|eukprot:XP_002260026.1 hypothetical protein, conserved in Plasmodium species [Plasmodium knowlesi strain H]
MKVSFFDDEQSMESKRDRDKEEGPRDTRNEGMRSQSKAHDVIIKNEDEPMMLVDLKRKRRMNPDDEYYSVKLPKFIGVCPDIGKVDGRGHDGGIDSNRRKGAERIEDATPIVDARNVIDLEGEGRHAHMAKNQKAIISWNFDVDAYNREKGKKDSHAMKEEEKKPCAEKEDSHKRDEALEVHSDLNDLPHLTDDDLSEFSTVDELYKNYQVTHNCDDLMSFPSDDANDKTTILCRNMEFLETNSFIVEYEDGKLIFFINEKPYLLESDKETNYLIELSDMNIMPIHCILEKKLFFKSITREEQGATQGNTSPEMVDIYYSLHG